MLRSRIGRLFVLLALAAPLATTVACGGSKNEPKMANVQPGAMPAGGEWPGVYYSQLYGYLHVVADGDNVSGAWRTTAGDAYGEMHGKVDGDLFKYAWVERRIGSVGADAERKGNGFFRYTVPKEGEAHEIVGEWGLSDSDAGNAWRAVKQKNMQPDPKSVKPDEVEGRVQGVDNWDNAGDGASEGDSDKKKEDSDSDKL
jgi:hypothetical protein